MVRVTPWNGHYTYGNQDCDEQNTLLADLSKNRREYLSHPDSLVRSLADWTMELYGLRTLRSGYARRHPQSAPVELQKLSIRLRVLVTHS